MLRPASRPGPHGARRSPRRSRARARASAPAERARPPPAQYSVIALSLGLETGARRRRRGSRRSGRGACARASRARGARRRSVSAAKPTSSGRCGRAPTSARMSGVAHQLQRAAGLVLLDLVRGELAPGGSRRRRRRETKTSWPSIAASTASRIAFALRTSMRVTRGGVGSATGPATSVTSRRRARRPSAIAKPMRPRAAVADEAHRIDVLVGRAGADQHARARRARPACAAPPMRATISQRLEHAARRRTRRRPGRPSRGRARDAARAQRRDVRLRRRVRPHLLVHRRRERERRRGRQAQRREQVVGEAGGEARDHVGGRRRDDDRARPSAPARCGPSRLRRPRPTATCAPGCPDSAWNVSGVDEALRALGHHHAHFGAGVAQAAHQVGGLVRGDAAATRRAARAVPASSATIVSADFESGG